MAIGVDVRVAGLGEEAVGGLDGLGRGVVVDLRREKSFFCFQVEVEGKTVSFSKRREGGKKDFVPRAARRSRRRRRAWEEGGWRWRRPREEKGLLVCWCRWF